VSTWMEEHAPLQWLIIFNSSTDSIMKPDARWKELRNLFREFVSRDQIRGMFWVVTGTTDG